MMFSPRETNGIHVMKLQSKRKLCEMGNILFRRGAIERAQFSKQTVICIRLNKTSNNMRYTHTHTRQTNLNSLAMGGKLIISINHIGRLIGK